MGGRRKQSRSLPGPGAKFSATISACPLSRRAPVVDGGVSVNTWSRRKLCPSIAKLYYLANQPLPSTKQGSITPSSSIRARYGSRSAHVVFGVSDTIRPRRIRGRSTPHIDAGSERAFRYRGAASSGRWGSRNSHGLMDATSYQQVWNNALDCKLGLCLGPPPRKHRSCSNTGRHEAHHIITHWFNGRMSEEPS